MKYIVVLGDGMSDLKIEELDNKTCLESAVTPALDRLAALSETGLCKTVPNSLKPGSDVANMSVLGFDPLKYYTGRSPLEAVSMGINLKSTDVTLRCNLVTLSDGEPYENKTMLDYSAGEITTADDLTPPHDISDKKITAHLPKGKNAAKYLEFMKRSYGLLSSHPVNLKRISEGKKPANSIWLWGEGTKPAVPSFKSIRNLKGGIISAVDLVKGIGILAGMDIIEVEGATGNYNTDFQGKANAAAIMRIRFIRLSR